MKKIITIFSIIIFIAAIGIGFYFAWKKSNEVLNPPASTPSSVSKISVSAPSVPIAQKLKMVSAQSAYAVWKSQTATSSGIFYMNQSGQILKIAENQEEMISDRQIDSIRSVEASRDGKIILIKYGQANNLKFEVFNIDKKIWQVFSNISAFTISPDDKKIAYLENGSSLSNLMIKDVNSLNQAPSKIVSINQKDFSLVWPLQDKIFFVSKPSAYYSGEIWQVSVKNKTIAPFSEGYGLIIKWSDNSNYGLRFATSPQKENQLNLINDSGAIKADLNFITLPQKCVINYPVIYCALPSNYNSLKEPSLPDDYLKRAAYSSDSIYSINIENNSYNKIYEAGSSGIIDATDPIMINSQIIFINRYDNKIYSIQI